MASHQSTTGTAGHTTGMHGHKMMDQQGAAAMAEQATGVRDKMYDVISVLYHALQGGETCMQYLHDAEQAGDQELVQFFQEVQDCQRHLATRAKAMLMRHMDQGNGHGSAQGQNMHRSADAEMAGAVHRGKNRDEHLGHDRGQERQRR